MKNRISKLICSALVLSFVSCSDLLDVEAENSLSGDLLTSQPTMEQALDGAYFNLFGIYDGGNGGELLGGDFKMIPTLLTRHQTQEVSWQSEDFPDYLQFSQKNITNINPRVEANWIRGYETINLVNGILEKIDVVKDQAAKEEIQGQALAIRGILYFEMVRLWAPQYESSTLSTPAIPIRTKAVHTKADIGTTLLSTVGEVYQRAEEDLMQASALLNGKNIAVSKISYAACQSYLGKISLQKGGSTEFGKAEDFFTNAISEGFILNASPLDAFNNATATTEDVLAINQNIVSSTGNLSSATGLSSMFSSLSSTGYGAMQIVATAFDPLQKTFIPNNPSFYNVDLRHSIQTNTTTSSNPNNIDSAFYQNGVRLSSSKFLKNTDVIPVIRLSELYLGRAEAIHEQVFTSPIDPLALSDVNRVRTRAGLPALLDTLSAFEFLDSIKVERAREFIYEGVLFHDLKRWAVNDADVSIAFGQDPLNSKFILPIPQSECDASGICN